MTSPLAGVTVLDVSRMLPGAVLVRMLVDLGARVIKVEDPRGGDPMRLAQPLVDGVGAGFAAFFRGTESVTLDLRGPEGQEALRRLAGRADVLIESFRPGTMDRWGLGAEALHAENPGLVICSLSAFGPEGGLADRVGHDMNFVGMSGLLSLLPAGEGLPRVQFADVASGMLAATSVLAALMQKAKTGRGMHLHQPLALGPLPFLTWAMADDAAGGGGMPEAFLSGAAPAYRVYACQDGLAVVLGAIEPKFWVTLMQAMGLEDLAGAGLYIGAEGEAVAERVAAVFASAPRGHWLALAERENLPLTPVHDLKAARETAYYQANRAYMPAWGTAEEAPVPALGQGNATLLEGQGS